MVHLSWNIIGDYEKDCTVAKLYDGIKSGSKSINFWSFLDKIGQQKSKKQISFANELFKGFM